MFDYIKGEKISALNGVMVVENGGIGYSINVSDECVRNLADQTSVKVFTYLSVREDGVSLFGFYSEAERTMFCKLISVSGIGPKVAVAILSGISVDKLAANIIAQDTKALNKIKGVGKKTAERIVLELKDKIGKDFADSEPCEEADEIVNCNDDAVMALMALGFTRVEAEKKVSLVATEDMTVEEIIFSALKNS